eukprot:Amastigsp_a688303_19.p3 type:complete len:108 gc:universal Amastigsp_a688303_19:534-857(+)
MHDLWHHRLGHNRRSAVHVQPRVGVGLSLGVQDTGAGSRLFPRQQHPCCARKLRALRHFALLRRSYGACFHPGRRRLPGRCSDRRRRLANVLLRRFSERVLALAHEL